MPHTRIRTKPKIVFLEMLLDTWLHTDNFQGNKINNITDMSNFKIKPTNEFQSHS